MSSTRTKIAAPPSDRPLMGQVIVVTGASRGIGRAIAIRFAAAGAAIVCAARTESEIERTAASIDRAGGSALAIVCDVRDEEAVTSLFDRTVDELGRLDVAVLNAGIQGPHAPVESVSTDIWHDSIDTNLTGTFLGLRAAVPHLKAAGGGKIIVVGSAAARRASAGLAAYAVASAGLTTLVRVAARELRGFSIAVNELQPGPTATAMHGVPESLADTLVDREVVLEEGLEEDVSIAGEWFKSPRSVADAALFLACLPNHGPSGQILSLNCVA